MRWIFLAWSAALLGCGSLNASDFRGPSLGTLKGELASSFPIEGKVRLALVWSPYNSFKPDEPVFTERQAQELEYEAHFPIHFSFDLYGPPPARALPPEGSGGVAYGNLVAYQDLNGNGTLDIIRKGSRPVDRVLASSQRGESPFHTGDSYTVIFSAEETPEYPKGYRIVYTSPDPNEAERLADFIPMRAFNSNFLNDKICDLGAYFCRCTAPDLVFVRATLSRRADKDQVFVTSSDCDSPFARATVTLNGVIIPELRPSVHEVLDDTRSLLVNGLNELRVQVPGKREVVMSGLMDVITITSPADGSVVKAGTALPVSWTSSGEAPYYRVGIISEDYDSPPSFTSKLTATVPGEMNRPGQSLLRVESIEDGVWTEEGSSMVMSAESSVRVESVP